MPIYGPDIGPCYTPSISCRRPYSSANLVLRGSGIYYCDEKPVYHGGTKYSAGMSSFSVLYRDSVYDIRVGDMVLFEAVDEERGEILCVGIVSDIIDDMVYFDFQEEISASPTITPSDILGGHRLTITDINGVKMVDIMDGSSSLDSPITNFEIDAITSS